MQTQSFQQNNRAQTERLIFQYHQSEESGGSVDHRNLCAAVRAWAASEGRLTVALQIKKMAEEMMLEDIELNVQPEVWNVKMFRWLDNKEKSATYQANVELLAPAILSALPLAYCARVVKVEAIDTGCDWVSAIRLTEHDIEVMDRQTKKDVLAQNKSWQANCQPNEYRASQ